MFSESLLTPHLLHFVVDYFNVYDVFNVLRPLMDV